VLVLDASTLLAAALADRWDLLLGHDRDLITPPLGRSEAMSSLHEAAWRGDVSPEHALQTLHRLMHAPVAVRPLSDSTSAWRLADGLGWAKSYDAEYIALTQELDGGLVTLDARLRRRVRDLVRVLDVSVLP
jgi:predicted nucleic acid-binding protein